MADIAQEKSVSEEAEAALIQLSKDPKFQSVLQKHLNASRGIYSNLSLPVKKRVRALKNVQVDLNNLEAQFYEEVQRLEAKYQSLYQPHFDKRKSIVSGSYEPTAEECKWMDSDEDEDEEDDEKETKAGNSTNGDESALKNGDGVVNGAKANTSASGGVPEFWLTAMRNTDIFEDYIMDHDEPILVHLTDIKLIYTNDKGLGFNLEFHFSENEYFTNKVLTKSYSMSCEVSPDDPFSFEGATITEVKGCKIDWKKGMNVTVKTIKKKQKHKGKGQSRVITKTVPNDSFFNFFSPPDPNTFDSKEEEEVDELSVQLEGDISRAEFIRDRLIPKAVLYFTGDLIDNEDDDDVEISDDEDEDGDDSEPDDDYNPQPDLQNAKPPECKQQ